jgi:hypothetical protein
MRLRRILALLSAAVIGLAACNTTESRIRRQQALFEGYPPEVQHNIRNGVIEIGYSPDMVLMALGSPDRRTEVKTGDGTAVIWTYRKSWPGFTVEMGSGGYVSSRVGVSSRVAVGEPAGSEDRAVVEFWQGRVSRFEFVPD